MRPRRSARAVLDLAASLISSACGQCRTLARSKSPGRAMTTVWPALARRSDANTIACCCCCNAQVGSWADSVCRGRDRSQAGECSVLRPRSRDIGLKLLCCCITVRSGMRRHVGYVAVRTLQVGAPASSGTRAISSSRAYVAGWFGKVRRGRTPEFTGRRWMWA